MAVSASWTLRALVALIGLGPSGLPALAASQSAPVSATAVKPVSIRMLQSLDLGTLTLGPGLWSNVAVSISQAGALSCGNANVVCSGLAQVAQYNVQGSNRQTVRISAPNVTMVNQSDPSKTLTLVTDAPSSVVLTSSGMPGTNFSIGGSITVSSTTPAGTYVGTFNVTAEY